jgi:hypothetical protein
MHGPGKSSLIAPRWVLGEELEGAVGVDDKQARRPADAS